MPMRRRPVRRKLQSIPARLKSLQTAESPRRGLGEAASEQSALGEGDAEVTCDDDVIEDARTSTSASASRSVRVSNSSARLGSATPEGWL